MWLLDFLFGKKPEINFTKEGKTTHNFPEEKWDLWKNRFQKNPEYDWRAHTGKRTGAPKKSQNNGRSN